MDVVATRDAKNLYLHILNTDYAQPHRIALRLDGLTVAGTRATLHRLRFLTRDEAPPNGPWTRAETETLPLRPVGFESPLPSRSATIIVIPLQ